MAARLQYQIVGRYMDRTEVVAYHLHCLSNGKSVKLSKEQVAFLVGRGQVTNCQGQIYQDKLLLRGVGVSLDSLPTKQVNQEGSGLKNTDSIGKIRKGTSVGAAMSQLMIVQFIVDGKRTVKAVLRNSGGGTVTVERDELLALASEEKIGNARVQKSNDRVILRGVNCDLRKIPTVDIKASETTDQTLKAQKTSSKSQPISKGKKTLKDIANEGLDTFNSEDLPYIKRFRKACIEAFINANKNYGNILTLDGFSGDTGDELDRFDFSVKNKPTVGGFATIEHHEKGYLVELHILRHIDSDVEMLFVTENRYEEYLMKYMAEAASYFSR